jgi:hypothetical protein
VTRTSRIIPALLGISLLFQAAGAAAADPDAEIEFLIDSVRKSTCVFIRNGAEYDGSTAADHVRQKYDYYKSDIRSAEDFIDRAASKSLVTGKPYEVHCAGASAVPAADWLRDQLRTYRSQHP